MPRFDEIKKLTSEICYTANFRWSGIQKTIKEYVDDGLNMDPEFQRGHVWNESQKIAYIEYKLKGGAGANEIKFNCPGWNSGKIDDFVLVDGKQRLAAVDDFFNNKIKAFGYFYSEYEDKNNISRIDFVFKINHLKTNLEVLNWYIEINTTGTPHTYEEINKVKDMISVIENGVKGNKTENKMDKPPKRFMV